MDRREIAKTPPISTLLNPAASSIHDPSIHLKTLTLTALNQSHEKRPIFTLTIPTMSISSRWYRCARPPANVYEPSGFCCCIPAGCQHVAGD